MFKSLSWLVPTGLVLLVGYLWTPGIERVSAARANWVTALSFLISVPGFGFTLWTLIRMRSDAERARRGREEISISVRFGDAAERLWYRPRRSQVTRGELLGIIGMFGGSERFEPAGLIQTIQDELKRVEDGKSDHLTIPLDQGDERSARLFREIRKRNELSAGTRSL